MRALLKPPTQLADPQRRAVSLVGRRSGSRRHRAALGLEQLETRELLAVFTVRTSADTNRVVLCNDPSLSLREAINCANTSNVDDVDTIEFNILTGDTVNLTLVSPGTLDLLLLSGKGLVINGTNQATAQRITLASSTGKNIFNMVPLFFGEGGPLEATISDLRITGGQDFDGQGGAAIRNEAGVSLTLNRVMADANIGDQVGSRGGAIANHGNLLIVDSTITNNFGFGGGGGIASFQGSALTIRNSTISGNSTAGDGGGILAIGATFSVEQSTISGNQAQNGSGGGLALAASPGQSMNVTIVRSTIVNNHAVNGGGIHMAAGVNLFLSNSIVAQNSAQNGPDIFDAAPFGVVAQDSFVGTNAGNGLPVTMSGNIIGGVPPISPELGPLANNGGLTLTHLPLAGSLVIDRGSGARPGGVDQRGYSDPTGSTPDIGSVEFDAVPPPGGDFDHDGNYNCADLNLLTAAVASGNNNPTFDLNGDSIVNFVDVATWLSNAGGLRFGSGRSYLVGDANLDGVVDGSDFGLWNANKFTSNTAWCSGNFNADGVIDGADFGLWNSNKFLASDAGRAERVWVLPQNSDATDRSLTKYRRGNSMKLSARLVDAAMA